MGLRTTKVRLLEESIIAKLATNQISIFSVAEQAGLGITWSLTSKTGFLAHRIRISDILP